MVNRAPFNVKHALAQRPGGFEVTDAFSHAALEAWVMTEDGKKVTDMDHCKPNSHSS